MLTTTLLALVTAVTTLAPDVPLAQALSQALEAAGVAPTEAPSPDPLATTLTWTAYIVGKPGDGHGFLVACQTDVLGINSRAPHQTFLGCSVEEGPVTKGLPVIPLKALFTLAGTLAP